MLIAKISLAVKHVERDSNLLLEKKEFLLCVCVFVASLQPNTHTCTHESASKRNRGGEMAGDIMSKQ